MNFSTTKLLALLALIFVLNLPKLSLGQCGPTEIDCTRNGEFRCCNGSAVCVLGSTSSGCCGAIQGQTGFCCQNNGTCLCAYAPAQKCCGSGADDGFVCGADSICCGSTADGTNKCCGMNQICTVSGECINKPIPTVTTPNETAAHTEPSSLCPQGESLCGTFINASSCCTPAQTCVTDSVSGAAECCDQRLGGNVNETAMCCHNAAVGCICAFTPSQQCCGTGRGDGFVCAEQETCCGSIAAGTNKCCPKGTTCSAVDDSCVADSPATSSEPIDDPQVNVQNGAGSLQISLAILLVMASLIAFFKN